MSDANSTASASPFDLLVRGGRVFEPEKRASALLDVGIAGGKVAALAPDLAAPAGCRVLDAGGRLVTPGLVDAHAHAFPLVQLIGLDVDPVSSRSGVTTFVDAGTTGALHFLAFRHYVIDRARSNIFALLNVSAVGQTLDGIRGLEVFENDDPRFLHLPAAIELVEGNRDVIVGIKVRLYHGLASLAPLAAARDLADEVGLPLEVHTVSPPPSFRDILPYLRPGDIATHVYHPGPQTMVDGRGQVRPEWVEARARGILFDTGSARIFTHFPTIRAAIEQGYGPDFITTDLTTPGVEQQTISLPHTLNKFVALGVPFEEALYKVTAGAARLLPPDCGLGRLAVGLPADLAVFDLEEGEFTYDDFFGNSVVARQRLVPVATIKDGEVLTPQPHVPLPWRFIRRGPNESEVTVR
ncbi:MAG: amidohydrolase family protein [Chloroflexota bacterium]